MKSVFLMPRLLTLDAVFIEMILQFKSQCHYASLWHKLLCHCVCPCKKWCTFPLSFISILPDMIMARQQEVSFLSSFILVVPTCLHCVGSIKDYQQICVCLYICFFIFRALCCKLFSLRLSDARSVFGHFIYILVTYFYNVCLCCLE